MYGYKIYGRTYIHKYVNKINKQICVCSSNKTNYLNVRFEIEIIVWTWKQYCSIQLQEKDAIICIGINYQTVLLYWCSLSLYWSNIDSMIRVIKYQRTAILVTFKWKFKLLLKLTSCWFKMVINEFTWWEFQ